MSLAIGAIAATLLGRLLLTHFERDLRVNAFGLLALSYALGLGAFTWAMYLFVVLGGRRRF